MLFLGLMLVAPRVAAMPPHPNRPAGPAETDPSQRPFSPQTSVDRALPARTGAFPSDGTHHVLVVLVPYSDLSFSSASTESFYLDLLAGNAGATGLTLARYFQDVSGGALNLEFSVLTIAPAPEPYAYYGANLGGRDVRPEALAAWAASTLVADHDHDVDFSRFDNDGDGEIDTIILIHAGIGEEASGAGGTEVDPDAVWSHHWDLESAGVTPPTADGVSISRYTAQPEYVFDPGDTTIGVFAHEFGHALGLPDLYDTGIPEESDGIGDWGLMGKGAWLGPDYRGSVPAPPSPWSLVRLGWIEVEDVTRQVFEAGPSASGILASKVAREADTVVVPATHATPPQTAHRRVATSATSPATAAAGRAFGVVGALLLLFALLAALHAALRRRGSFQVEALLPKPRPTLRTAARTAFPVVSGLLLLATCTVYVTYTLAVASEPFEGGVVAAADGSPFSPDPAGYPAGSKITIEAIPADGYRFSEWRGTYGSESAEITLHLVGDTTATAVFLPERYSPSVTVKPTGSGSVELIPAGPYEYGAEVTATAFAFEGFEFTSWSGALDSSANPLSFTVEGSLELNADFTALPAPNRFDLSPLQTGRRALRLDLAPTAPGEYLLLAHLSTQSGPWTAYLPGSGLLILHVNDAVVAERLDGNTVNALDPHGIALIEADGNDSLATLEPDSSRDTGSPGDLYPSLSDSLINPVTHDGSVSPLAIRDISVGSSSTGPSISFEAEYGQ